MLYFKYDEQALSHLKSCDAQMKAAIERLGWIDREIVPDLYEGLISSIIAQQISSKAATTVWKRLENLSGGVTPESVGKLSAEAIQKCGMTMRKATYIESITASILVGTLHLKDFETLSDKEVINALKALPGIGIWTAEMLMIFSMQRMDVLSYDDLAIRRGLMNLYGLEQLDKKTFEKYRQMFSPYGSVASLYLWALS